MLRYIVRHLSQYILVLVIFTIGLASFWLLESESTKIVIAFAFSALYFLWGIAHYAGEHTNIQTSTFLEYLVLSGLILFVLLNLV